MRIEDATRVPDLFAAASELGALERGAFLEEACAGNEALRAEVESLLRAQEQGHGFLDKPAFDLGAEALADAPESELEAGDMLGEYRILSLLGTGGMGEVYLARDLTLDRAVAVKLIRGGHGAGALLRHFRHERQVLAGLNHPNIARLYDGAVTPEGRAYLVMEYVEGERLDEYCQRLELPTAERLVLFRKICSAVAYAHQNLVIHRDLKPANIRLTAGGEPKLLDFGIAKLLEPEGTTAAGLEQTMTLGGMMTPEYASPEQLRGEPITTATDVYSLGVILYELLCGERPFRLTSRRPDLVARAICDLEPQRPSVVWARNERETGSTGAGARRSSLRKSRLAGDLDNIVAMAMRKDPARRYASVSLLSEDIRRHGDGLTVVARPDTLGYRTAKFVQRNKMAVGAAAVFLLALVAALIVISFEAQRANRRFEDVRRLANSILFEIEPQMATVSGTTQARVTLVRRATDYLDSLSQEAGNDRSLRRDLAAAYEKVGDAQGNPNEANLGNLKAALAAYGKARALREALVKTSPKDARARHELAGAYEKIGTALWWNDHTDSALANYHAALALRRVLIAEQPRSMDFRWGFASLEMNLADVAAWNGDNAEALADLRQALAVLQALAEEQPSNVGTQINLARCIERIGMAYSGTADYTAAVDQFRRAEALVEPITRRDPENYPAQLQYFNDVFGECVAYKDQRAVDKALAIAPVMIGVIEALVRKDPRNTSATHSMANSYSCYGEAFLQAARWQEALDPLQKGLAIDVRLGEQSPENGEYVHSRGAFQMDMGEALLHLGRLEEATADEQAAQTLLETSAAKDPGNSVPRRELVKVFILQGEILENRGQPMEARRAFEQGLAGLEALTARKIVNKDDPEDFALLRAKLASVGAP